MTEKIITKNLEQRAKDNPDKILEHIFLTIDTQNPEESKEKLQDYVIKNKIKGRVGYLSDLDLTGNQILHLSNQSYISVISQQHPEVFRACD